MNYKAPRIQTFILSQENIQEKGSLYVLAQCKEVDSPFQHGFWGYIFYGEEFSLKVSTFSGQDQRGQEREE